MTWLQHIKEESNVSKFYSSWFIPRPLLFASVVEKSTCAIVTGQLRVKCRSVLLASMLTLVVNVLVLVYFPVHM